MVELMYLYIATFQATITWALNPFAQLSLKILIRNLH
jgi:hypothetical protein